MKNTQKMTTKTKQTQTSYEEVFSDGDGMIILKKDNGESRENFLTRGHFIVRNIDRADINTLTNVSRLYINVYIHGQTFGSKVEKELEKYDCSVI